MNYTNKVRVYLVGGAVRDKVLGRVSKDLDFVVVGATRGYMECLGFTQVGADFPVFLHPNSKDEFALARMERKTAAGYKGFDCEFNTDVTLEDDLVRRDLTMNAMAIEVDPNILETGEMELIGEIIDPYNGQVDAVNGILRHTSDAFAEDPLRVLRTCRFAARYNFEIAPDTISLMQDIIDGGEMDALPMERVYAEFEKTMMEAHPERFFRYLLEVNALDIYFAELMDCSNDSLRFAVSINAPFEVRVAMLLVCLEHDDAERLLTRIKAPNHLMDVVLWTCNLEYIVDRMSPPFFDVENITKDLWKLLNKFNAWRNLEKLKTAAGAFIYVIEDTRSIPVLDRVVAAAIAGSEIGFDDLDPDTRDSLVGKEIGEAISKRRLVALEELKLFPS